MEGQMADELTDGKGEGSVRRTWQPGLRAMGFGGRGRVIPELWVGLCYVLGLEDQLGLGPKTAEIKLKHNWKRSGQWFFCPLLFASLQIFSSSPHSTNPQLLPCLFPTAPESYHF